MPLPKDVIRLEPVRMGDLLQEETSSSKLSSYIPPHLRSAIPESVPELTTTNFPSLSSVEIKQTKPIQFKQMLEEQKEKEKLQAELQKKEPDERQKLLEEGWSLLEIKKNIRVFLS
jgi:hypothetical protein